MQSLSRVVRKKVSNDRCRFIDGKYVLQLSLYQHKIFTTSLMNVDIFSWTGEMNYCVVLYVLYYYIYCIIMLNALKEVLWLHLCTIINHQLADTTWT